MFNENHKLQYDKSVMVDIIIRRKKELTMGQKILGAILVILVILLSYLLPQGPAIYNLMI